MEVQIRLELTHLSEHICQNFMRIDALLDGREVGRAVILVEVGEVACKLAELSDRFAAIASRIMQAGSDQAQSEPRRTQFGA